MDLQGLLNILSLCFLLLNSCFGQETQVKCINPEFEELVDDYLNYSIPFITVADAYDVQNEYTFLDARELVEYQTSHIKGAIHIGYDNFDIKTIKDKIEYGTPIIIYCSIGYRSEIIGKKLTDYGYKNVRNLYGSIFEWVNQHRPVFDSNEKQTKDIHTYNKKWSKWVENEQITKTWTP